MDGKFVLVTLLLMAASATAQDISVKKFELAENDQTAALSPRKDINGVTCGLVKVQLKESGVEFEGNVMGDVQFTGNEYLVYITNGSKRLGIKHPDYLPTTIVFADHGTKKIESGNTYLLNLKTNKKKGKAYKDNGKKGMAVFNIKPSNAMLLIDGQVADGSGGAYTLSLPYGKHYYTVKLKDFSLTNIDVTVGKEAKTIDVDLTEYYANLDVFCVTPDAEIVVNGELMGVGTWNGKVPPGSYSIEVMKDGCHGQSRQITLADNESKSTSFSELKTITGSLRVDYKPDGSDVLLNGKKVGVTPLVLKEIPIGKYQMEIWKEYYVKEFYDINIAEDQEWKESGELKLTDFGKIIVNAENGKENSIYDDEVSFIDSCPMAAAQYYRVGAASGYRGDHYACEKDTFHVPLNPVKAIYWLKKVAKGGDEYESKEAIELLGPGYPNEEDDAILSFLWAEMERKKWVDNYGEEARYYPINAPWGMIPYTSLAWHYFYGIGCEKDVEEAKKLIRGVWRNENCRYPACLQLIKDMGLDTELIIDSNARYSY